MTPLEILRQARRMRVENPDVRYVYRRPEATPGAAAFNNVREARRVLWSVCIGDLQEFVDRPETTLADVLALFDRAIAKLEGER